MANKKNIGLSCANFKGEVDEIFKFLASTVNGQTDAHVYRLYDYAIVALYREFEMFILECLTAIINNDTKALSDNTGYNFPKHLTDEVCEYIIIGDRYFSFSGKGGLIRSLRKCLAKNHWLIELVKQKKYEEILDRLSALRNYAAHGSGKAKKDALETLPPSPTKQVPRKRINTSGTWLKRKGRFDEIANKLKKLADDIEAASK